MECNSFDGRDASYCKRARFADRNVRATRLGSVSGEWRPKCVLTMIPPSRAKDAQGWAAHEWDGRDARPSESRASAVTDC